MDTFVVQAHSLPTWAIGLIWFIVSALAWITLPGYYRKYGNPQHGRIWRILAPTLFLLPCIGAVGHNQVALRVQGDRLEARGKFGLRFRSYDAAALRSYADAEYTEWRRRGSDSHYGAVELRFTDGYTVTVDESMSNYDQLRSYLERRGVRHD